MQIYTHTGFEGHWPVGTLALVIADTKERAALLLEQRLGEIGLGQSINPDDFTTHNPSSEGVFILQDGNY